MRLPLMAQSDLSPEQQQLYEDMRRGIEANFKGVIAIDNAGRVIGPWNPWLHFVRRPGVGTGQSDVLRAGTAASGPRDCDPGHRGTLPFGL
jgi:4-carboxymuconolactone decarboxylase